MKTKTSIPESFIQEDSVDFKRYISLFVSNWYWFAVSLFIAFCISYGINRWSEKIFTVSSSMLIRNDQTAAYTNIFPGTEALQNQQNLNNEIGILRSFDLNYKVIKKLPEFALVYTSVGKRGIAETRLYKTAPFVVCYDSLKYQTIGERIEIRILSDTTYSLKINHGKNIEETHSFNEEFHENGFDFTISLRDSSFRYDPGQSNRFYFYFTNPVTIANSYRSKLSIVPIEEGASMVQLTTSGFVPDQEIDYLNTLMDVYLNYGLENKNKTAEQSINFIQEQLGSISDSLRLVENELEKFRLKNKLIDISREGSQVQNKLEQIDAEKTKLELQRNYYDYLKAFILGKNDGAEDIVSPSIIGITDQLLIRQVEELSSLLKEKRRMTMNYKLNSSPLTLVETNIMKSKSALLENIGSGIRNIDSSFTFQDNRLAEIEKEAMRLPQTERQMINIQRKLDINNTVYTFLLEKRAEAGIAKASNVPDNRIIDKAGYFSSSMIRPRKGRNNMVALLIGLLAPFAGIILIDYLNNKIIDKKDIEGKTSVPVIGYISHNSLSSEIPVSERPGSTISESFRSVRTNLRYFFPDLKCPVISITSTITGEGKTFVSSNLAIILALSGKKTLLLGLDLRKPRIHRIFGISNEKGISSFLVGDTEDKDIVINTGIDNLCYAPSGPVPPNPAELIDSEKMREFISESRKKFDFIVIDTPPVAIVTDALLVSAFTDLYLFVVRQRYSSLNTLELIEELNENKNIKSLGIILNDISTSGYYGYGLRYGYSMGYGYNYGYNYYKQYGKYGYTRLADSYYTDSEEF